MIASRSRFAFVGERDYIHAPMIFEGLRSATMAAAGQDGLDLEVGSFRVNAPVAADGEIRAFAAPPSPTHLAGAAAEMRSSLAGKPFWLALFREPSTAVVAREPATEQGLVREFHVREQFGGHATLAGTDTNYALMRAVAEANKQIHIASLPPRADGRPHRFRFVYCLGYVCPAHLASGEAELDIKHVGLQRNDGYVFTLNALSLSVGGRKHAFRLCYASRDIHDLV